MPTRPPLVVYDVVALPPASDAGLGALYRRTADGTYHLTVENPPGTYAYLQVAAAADVAAHAALTAAHGATGAVVGTTGAQTLTDKTLASPVVADFTNAAHDHADADDGGQLTDAALSAAVGVAKGGTGATDAAGALANLGAAPAGHDHDADYQPLDADLTALAAAITAAGHALVDDADAATQRATLGLGTMAVEGAADYLPAGGGTVTGVLTVDADLAIAVAGTQAMRLYDAGIIEFAIGSPNIRAGAGDPEGVVSAVPGSLFLSSNGNVYRKGSGTGNTGWIAT